MVLLDILRRARAPIQRKLPCRFIKYLIALRAWSFSVLDGRWSAHCMKLACMCSVFEKRVHKAIGQPITANTSVVIHK